MGVFLQADGLTDSKVIGYVTQALKLEGVRTLRATVPASSWVPRPVVASKCLRATAIGQFPACTLARGVQVGAGPGIDKGRSGQGDHCGPVVDVGRASQEVSRS